MYSRRLGTVWRARVWKLAVLTLATECMPDFDALTQGQIPGSCSGSDCAMAGRAGDQPMKGGSGGTKVGGTGGGGTAGTALGGAGDGGESLGGAGAEGGTLGESGGTGGTGNTGTGGKGGTAGKAGAGGVMGGTGGSSGSTTDAGMGGVPDCPTPASTTIFSFGTSLSADSGNWSQWMAFFEPTDTVDGISASTVTWSSENGRDGNPGMALLTVPFTDYGDGTQEQQRKVMGLINSPSEDWRCRSSLHAWVKIPLPSDAADYTYLQGLQLNASSTFLSNYDSFLAQFYDIAGWTDGEWHELVLALPPEPVEPPPQVGAYQPAMVVQLGVQIVGTITGSTTPVTTVVYIDDISIE